MQTWTVVRFLHIVGITFFVGGQLMLVAAVPPAIRKRGDETMQLIARLFGPGSTIALALAVATGVAMASHFSLWDSRTLQVKLIVLVLVGVLTALHILTPNSRAVSYDVVVSSLVVLWFGVKLTFG